MAEVMTTGPQQLIKLIDSDKVLEMETMEAFNAIINMPPPEDWLAKHPLNDKVKYLPIGRTEALLTRVFQQWRVEALREGQLANSIYCAIRLHYKHPIEGWTSQGS